MISRLVLFLSLVSPILAQDGDLAIIRNVSQAVVDLELGCADDFFS